MKRKQVVLGFLGVSLDNGPQGHKRWQKWRPTVSLCQHEGFIVDRMELLADSRYEQLSNQVAKDIAQVSPETDVHQVQFDLKDPWDFEAVYAALLDFALEYEFDLEHEDYYLHITTGTHVAQI